MKALNVILIFLGINLNIKAQDSINDYRGSITLSVDNNYNYRYVRIPTGRDNGIEKMNYLDTCNIACSMKSFSIMFERKIWKFISFQTGFIYGRKGIIGCRDIVPDYVGRMILIYTEVPFKSHTIPIGISINKNFIKSRIIFSLHSGFEINFISNREQNTSYGKRTIEGMQFGYFGFVALQKIDNQLSFKEDTRPDVIQYYVGLNFKIKILKKTFLNLDYNYISDLNFSEKNDSFHIRPFIYERKSYIHRYGAGIGFMF
ncbi:MAG TPA: hypothetical protein PK323_15055 [Bacteroidia bacterium]|nr:hypothetical protein [Bacteroidia bacterium]